MSSEQSSYHDRRHAERMKDPEYREAYEHERVSYNAVTLRADLDGFEARYGMSSELHYALRYSADGRRHKVPGFDSHVWADLYREWLRLKESSS